MAAALWVSGCGQHVSALGSFEKSRGQERREVLQRVDGAQEPGPPDPQSRVMGSRSRLARWGLEPAGYT